MTTSLALSLIALCMAATAGVAFLVSALAAPALLARRALDRLTPAAQARLLLAVAVLPAAATIAVMTAALAPSFGWIADHCLRAAEPHTHPHICEHHVASLPALPAVLLAALLLARLAHAALRLARQGLRARATRRELERIAATSGALRVLPLDAPQAFVIGLWRPALFVTRGLLADAYREHLAPVLAHERAHLGRRDPLRRLVAAVALAFHLPGVAGRLARRLDRAHEMAADAEAAAEIRSPERVARALVRLARSGRPAPAPALGFGASGASGAADLDARVTSLLDSRPRSNQPRPALIAALALVALALLGAGAELVHHGVEMFLGFLGA